MGIESENMIAGAASAAIPAIPPEEPDRPLSLPRAPFVRPHVRGKFLSVGNEKFWVRGVTYGTFRPDEHGNEFPSEERVESDFAQMAAQGINAVRTYTVPPRGLLDAAQRHGLRVMVGLAAERLVGFFVERSQTRQIEETIRAGVRACAGHPAVLCYTIANEIPAHVARWLGRRRMERYIEGLYRIVKAEDPTALATYVNYPSTEYLRFPFLDFVCFNVYLESQERFDAYLARLHNLAGDRPVIMSELGLDSIRNGEDGQARVLDWQVRTAFSAGCAGAFVFAWTDEWFTGGTQVFDWAFGLTRPDRRPKPALSAVRSAFGDVPFANHRSWPRISVVICSYNGASTIRDCFEALLKLEYRNSEVIVVNDGSNDQTRSIAEAYGFRVISTANHGLSSARNTGMNAATGDIIAYIDDDAYPDPHWLTYLAASFMSSDYVGVGGPNFPPPGDGPTAQCVANAPGGPVHVLLSDREAEHIPGCNMAFRAEALRAIGGFDPQFRSAGDDVDVCWRLQERGWHLGFNPAAVVWHHRRDSALEYWKQQMSYGRAEALLERKWPEMYNSAGHVSWGGRLYGTGLARAIGLTARIYHGPWGSAPFQSLYQPAGGVLSALPLMPEWYLLVLVLGGLSLLGADWSPLLYALAALPVAVGASIVRAGVNAAGASYPTAAPSRVDDLKRRIVTASLHLLQPAARLWGRVSRGLTPWRWRRPAGLALPWPRQLRIWSEGRQEQEARLRAVDDLLVAEHARVLRGGAFDRWDLEVRGGMFGAARLLMAVEEHGGGKQLVRVRCWPRCLARGLVAPAVLGAIAVAAALDHAWLAAAIFALSAAFIAVRMLRECSAALAVLFAAVDGAKSREP